MRSSRVVAMAGAYIASEVAAPGLAFEARDRSVSRSGGAGQTRRTGLGRESHKQEDHGAGRMQRDVEPTDRHDAEEESSTDEDAEHREECIHDADAPSEE